MIRLYANLAEYLLLSLLYIRTTLGSGATEGVYNNAVNYWYSLKYPDSPSHSKTIEVVRRMLGTRHRSSFEEIDEVIESLRKSLEASSHQDYTGDADLIDLIVNTLQLPHAKATLSGKLLEQLKKAILLPDERAKLTEMVEAKELACEGCGRQLQRGEMMMYAGYGTFFCHNCEIPNVVACHKCKENVATIPEKIHKAYAPVPYFA